MIATSLADPAKSATATVAITSGPVIEVMLPSSVFSGALESFPLAIQGANFIPGTGPSSSAILVNGTARGTSCATSTGCATALNLADVQIPGTLTIQIQNPAPSNTLSNPVPFVIAPLDTTVSAIPLTAAQPSAGNITLLVPEPTTAAESAPLNVDSLGPLTQGNCEIAGSPVTVTRPASGQVVAVDAGTGAVVAAIMAGWSCDAAHPPTRFDGSFDLERLPLNRSYNLYAEPLVGLAAPADFSFVFAGLCSSSASPVCTTPGINATFNIRIFFASP